MRGGRERARSQQETERDGMMQRVKGKRMRRGKEKQTRCKRMESRDRDGISEQGGRVGTVMEKEVKRITSEQFTA